MASTTTATGTSITPTIARTSVSDASGVSEQCDDGIDNDHNGLVDYPADPSCSDFNDHSERVPPVVEVVQDGLDLGNPLAVTVGDDGKVCTEEPSTPAQAARTA